jgi:hypothetical protein
MEATTTPTADGGARTADRAQELTNGDPPGRRHQETAMPPLLALAAMIRRRLPSIWSVLLVLTVLAAAAVVVLHSIATWITGHPLDRGPAHRRRRGGSWRTSGAVTDSRCQSPVAD